MSNTQISSDYYHELVQLLFEVDTTTSFTYDGLSFQLVNQDLVLTTPTSQHCLQTLVGPVMKTKSKKQPYVQ